MAREAALRHIVIAGNIGVGKSTLVGLLAERLGWAPVYELEEAHPYLADYYTDPLRWGFHSQVWFLTSRFRQHQRLGAMWGTVVQDRSIYEDAAVFAASLYEQGILAERDYVTYRNLYAAIARELRPPDLIVNLRASVPTLLQRIAGRARPAERAIQAEYLASLERHYAAWVAAWNLCPVLTIATDNLDIVNHPADQAAVIRQITAWEETESLELGMPPLRLGHEDGRLK